MTIRLLLTVAVVFVLSTLALGQTSRGTVSGTVTDPNGAVIAGAEVTHVCARGAQGFGRLHRGHRGRRLHASDVFRDGEGCFHP